MSSESKAIKPIEITVGLGDARDLKFLAAIDTARSLRSDQTPTEQFADRYALWRELLQANPQPEGGIFVARHGGLYVGYLAVCLGARRRGAISEDDIFVRPPYDGSSARDMLLERASVRIETSNSPSPLSDQVPEGA